MDASKFTTRSQEAINTAISTAASSGHAQVEAVHLLAALLAQADPGGSIDALAPPHIAPVMRAMPGIRAVLEMPNRHGKLDLRGRWRCAPTWRTRPRGRGASPRWMRSSAAGWTRSSTTPASPAPPDAWRTRPTPCGRR